MNTRFLAAASVGLNVALLLVALRTGRDQSGDGGTSAPAGGPAAANQMVRVKTNLTRVELTETNDVAPFRWSDVQSEDFKKYAANLLGVGCPHETVRAVLESEAWQEFLPRRRALLEPMHRQYWNLAASGRSIDKAAEPFGEELEKLKKEILGKVEGIVGGAAAEEKEKRRPNPHVDFLPAEKQRAVEELEKTFADETTKLNAIVAEAKKLNPNLKQTPELRAKRDQLQAKRTAGIRALMSAEELAEYDLRESPYASMAQSTVGFEPTPEESREVARILQQSQLADSKVDRKTPDVEAKKAQVADAKKQREEGLKQALGEERYAQLKQGLDSDFGAVYRITERYDLPRASAAQAADALKARSQALARLRGKSSQDMVDQTLAVNSATREELLRVLGERALRTYEKYHGPIIEIPEPDENQ